MLNVAFIYLKTLTWTNDDEKWANYETRQWGNKVWFTKTNDDKVVNKGDSRNDKEKTRNLIHFVSILVFW